MFAHQTACFRAEFEHRQSWRIVYIDGCALHFANVVVEPFPIGRVQLTAQNLATRDGTNVRKQAVHQLYVVHFEREESHRNAAVDGYILGKAEGERGLTHRRTPRNDDKVGRLPACCYLIQLCKARRDTCQAAVFLVVSCFHQQFVRLFHNGVYLRVLLRHILLREFKQTSFSSLHQFVHINGFVERLRLYH